MEVFTLPYYYLYGLCFFLALLVHVVLRPMFATTRKPGPKLPPGPWQLPVIGSLHHLFRGLPHRTMRDLSLRYGPWMLLRVCERVVIVVSSAEAVREVYKGHDAAFSERPGSPGIDELSRHGQGIIFAPYGDQWRLLRRILMTELLTARRVETFRCIREEEAARLVSSLRTTSSPNGGQLVNIDERLGEFMAASAVRAIFGDRLPESAAFLKIVKQGVDLSSLFDLRDLFPSSRFVRLLPRSGGKAERHRREMFRLMDGILQTHENRRAARDGYSEQNMVDVLQRIQKKGTMRVSLTHGVVKAMLTDVFGAAMDTTTTTLQWAMTELMANPKVMKKAQSEVRRVLVGQNKVCEKTLSDLCYLKTVIKETLRLHPPAPFFPRLCLKDSKIQGYDIPRGVTVLTNVWAISRDPKRWEEPDKFMPERFAGDGAVDFSGVDFEFTPFGVGRRICPGISFAYKNVEIALANLLYHFDWELPPGVNPEDIDMEEVFGLTVRRKAQLFLRPVSRFPLYVK